MNQTSSFQTELLTQLVCLEFFNIAKKTLCWWILKSFLVFSHFKANCVCVSLLLQFSPLLSPKHRYSPCFTSCSPPDQQLLTWLLSFLKLLSCPTKVGFPLLAEFSFLAYFLLIWICQSLRLYFLFLPQTGQQSNQSPMSLTSDASSPRSYVSPRISTPQTNAGPLKPLLSTQAVISQPKVRHCFNQPQL